MSLRQPFLSEENSRKNESIHADRRKALWGRWKAKKRGRNSRFGVPSYRKGWPKMSQQKAKRRAASQRRREKRRVNSDGKVSASPVKQTS